MDKNNVGFHAFIEFLDLGLDDYILDIDWDIHAKSYPLSSHTFGDLRYISNKPEISKKQKIFKILGPLKHDSFNSEQTQADLYKSDSLQKTNTHTEYVHENNVFREKVEKIVDNASEKIADQVINNNYFNDNINVKIEESVTNIQDVLTQQIEHSNSLTMEQITELEANMNLINHNHVYRQELKIIQEQTMEQNEKIRKDLKQDLESQKDFFIKFLNS